FFCASFPKVQDRPIPKPVLKREPNEGSDVAPFTSFSCSVWPTGSASTLPPKAPAVSTSWCPRKKLGPTKYRGCASLPRPRPKEIPRRPELQRCFQEAPKDVVSGFTSVA